MRIAIVDDLKEERNLLIERLTKQLNPRHLHTEIFEYENGEDFLKIAKANPFSVVFLDIYMNGLNGIDTAKELRDFDKDCILIFTTTSTDHALDGFRVRAMNYLVKPYTEDDLFKLVDEIIQRLPAADKYMNIKVDGCDLRLNFNSIVSAEHFHHKMQIKTSSKQVLLTRQTFHEFTSRLKDDDRFFICNRGVIINLEHALDFHDTSFTMDDGSMIHVSRNLLKSARQTFMDYLFKRRMF